MARLQNVFFVAADVEATAGFYRAVLGLEHRFDDPGRWVQLRAGGVNVAVAAPEEAPPGAGGTVAVFEVDDLDDALALARRHGAVVGEVRDMAGHGRTAPVRDPAGNLFQLFQRSPADAVPASPRR